MSREEEQLRDRLVVALEGCRDRAVLLAKEIASDHPDFTVHDESHFDALWALADRIAGPSLALKPTEAFGFGCAALIHDLGMASAAYTDGGKSLREDARWSDNVAFALRQQLGRPPSATEIADADEDILHVATTQLLRELHAERAEQLLMISWEGPRGEKHMLLEDSQLRETLGPVIGQIAHSHWWSTSTLGERFATTQGAPPGFPPDWTLRPLPVACLLRLADASHIDGSRAPRFLRALRKPAGEAGLHWDFQERLSQPYAEDGRFAFTSSKFGIDEARAWWLAADMLGALDGELRGVDALLADREEERFAIRGVAGAEDQERLTKYLPTEGWTPADAEVRVSNVVRLVERLGGRELYGSTPHVPLRELIQNASDAVRARRAIEKGRSEDWGDVVVRLSALEADESRWLEVEDTGVGMSRVVLTDHLLDFGCSFWESESVLGELPGLLASGFEPTGRFGIGFFSVFMWGEDVTVASRRLDAGKAETNVLEFSSGLANRPVLRDATSEEEMIDPGTRVRVRLDADVLWKLQIDEPGAVVPQLAALCGWLAPTLAVNLHVEAEGEARQTALEANDWLKIPMQDLRARMEAAPLRLSPRPSPEEVAKQKAAGEETAEESEEPVAASPDAALEAQQREWEERRQRFDDNARLLTLDDGTPVGRAQVDPLGWPGGVVTVGGFRSSALRDVSGVLLGSPTTASRHVGIPDVSIEILKRWASEQAELAAGFLPVSEALEVAETIAVCGGDTGPLPIILTSQGHLSRSEVLTWAASKDEILLLQDAALANYVDSDGEIELDGRVAAVGMTVLPMLRSDDFAGRTDRLGEYWPLERSDSYPPSGSLAALLLSLIVEAWGVTDEILVNALGSERDLRIGVADGAEVLMSALIARRAKLA